METIYAYLSFCKGNTWSRVDTKGPAMRRFNNYFDVSLNNIIRQTVEGHVNWAILTLIWRHCHEMLAIHTIKIYINGTGALIWLRSQNKAKSCAYSMGYIVEYISVFSVCFIEGICYNTDSMV